MSLFSGGGWLGVSWLVWALLCLGIAVAYTVYWPRLRTPEPAQRRAPWQTFVLRWLHGLTWYLLALFCLLRLWLPLDVAGYANWVALLALVCYLAFIGTLAGERLRRV